MKKTITIITLLGILNYCKAQVAVGSTGMNIKSGTVLGTQGLVLTPSSDLTIANNTQSLSATATTIGSGQTISRSYNFTSPINYSGTLKINYASGELNGNTEGTLQLVYNPLTSGSGWIITPGSTQGSTGTYSVSNTFSAINIASISGINLLTTTPPTASAQTFCSGSAPTVANLVATGTSLQWYTASAGGSALAASTTLNSGTYYVSQTLYGIESTRTSVVVTVSTTPFAPTASAQTFCNGATVANLVATPGFARLAPPASYKWYTTSSGGSALSTATTLSTGTYYVSNTIGSCESTRTAVSVTVNTTSAPTASAQTFCSGATVSDLVATGTSLKWYASSTGGSALAISTALNSGTYYVSQTLNSCESDRTSVVVTLDTHAVAGTISGETTVSSVTNSTTLNLSGYTG
ncbi:hypothetical protein, partial [uncultured Flavobacterium sp.]|uniref:immunoglobulin domain-containing protein n=1 Tax=uncultured Flavobacterium sp. TaxID=165435 RepID=UPI0025956823